MQTKTRLVPRPADDFGGIAEKVANGTLTGVAVDLIVKLVHGFLG